MNKVLRSLALGLIGSVALAVAVPASAAHGAHPGRHFMRTHPNVVFRHRFSNFTAHERSAWIGGHWWHGRHHGRLGWWWYASGGWFFYNAPIYPYPAYDSDIYYYDDAYGDDDDGYGDGPRASSSYWYFCRDPQGYYPYVKTCKADWQRVAPHPDDGVRDQGAPPDSYDRDRDDHGSYDNDNDEDNDDHGGPPPDDRHYDNGPDNHGAMNRDNDSDDADDDSDDDNDNGDQSNGPPQPLSH